jgi:hypothetical protein
MKALDVDCLARAISYGIQEVPGVLDIEVSICCDSDELPDPDRGTNDVVSVTGY